MELFGVLWEHEQSNSTGNCSRYTVYVYDFGGCMHKRLSVLNNNLADFELWNVNGLRESHILHVCSVVDKLLRITKWAR